MGDFPFCSQRCRTLDLASWLDGAYLIPEDPWGDDADLRVPDAREDD